MAHFSDWFFVCLTNGFIFLSESKLAVIDVDVNHPFSDPEEQEKEEAAKAEAAKAEAESAKVDAQAPETWVGDVAEADAAPAAPAAAAAAAAVGAVPVAGVSPAAGAAPAVAATAAAPAAPVDDWGQTVRIVLPCGVCFVYINVDHIIQIWFI